jgi:enamine deaminase RidA (YjgF/YER057c/UK114 family)
MHRTLAPKGWKAPIGYADGIAAGAGRPIFVAGQIGWDSQQVFHSEDLADQFEQALKNILAVLAEAGGRAEHICRMTAYCTSKPEYLASRRRLGPIWRALIGAHYPAMTMVFVTALLDEGAKIELEATAVVPPRQRAASARKKRKR